ncbi:hypothetical protein V2J09_010169 [Rumex salicifolius]
MLSNPILNGRVTSYMPSAPHPPSNSNTHHKCKLLMRRPLDSLSFLLSEFSSRSLRFRFRASAAESPAAAAPLLHDAPRHISVKIPVGDRYITVETGRIGRQASGAVMVTDGETVVYTTVCLSDIPSEPTDFYPLSVTYQERFSAAGRTSGGFFKREGRTKDHEVLVCRLIDRPLRPTMLKGFYHDTQVLSWVLSYDGLHAPDALAVTAAGIAVALSEVPNTETVAGVRIGLIGGKYIVNPTTQEMEESELDLLLAGTESGILMIEGYCNFLPEEKLLQAVEVGQAAVRAICSEVDALVRECGKPKMFDAVKLPPPDLYNYVEEIAGDELVRALQIKNKMPRRKALVSLEEKVVGILSEKGYISIAASTAPADTPVSLDGDIDNDDEDEEVVDGEVDEGDIHIKPTIRKSEPTLYSEVDVKLVYKEVTSKFLRKRIVEGGKRSDGRTSEALRNISSSCGLLPRAHGSALFTRGETQAIAVVTLGDRQMAQRIDSLEGDDELKRFYLQYSFPPSCVGEVGRIGGPSRRDIGHGTLAERSLERILPSESEFPYTIRVESNITESNGSSSMASVCGGYLALQDAGVPVKCPVAGIAMGLVAGSEDGITAFQLDIKVGGISLPVLKQALLQARDGRKRILDEMLKCSPPPSRNLSKHAPLIHVMNVRPEKINLIIGPGGKKVKSIIEATGIEAIDTRDDGTVKITSKDLMSLEKCKTIIRSLTMVPSVGDIYRDCEIKTIAPYGVFVEIAQGREGLCHISELSPSYLPKPEDAFKVGDRVDVKLIEVNEKGQLRLSRKALLPDIDPLVPDAKPRPTNPTKETSGSQSASSDSVPKRSMYGYKDKSKEGSVKSIYKKSSKVSNAVSDDAQSSNLVNGEAKVG